MRLHSGENTLRVWLNVLKQGTCCCLSSVLIIAMFAILNRIKVITCTNPSLGEILSSAYKATFFDSRKLYVNVDGLRVRALRLLLDRYCT